MKQFGGTIDDSQLIRGLVFSKGFDNSGEKLPSTIENAKIALIQFCLSAPKTDMEVSIDIGYSKKHGIDDNTEQYCDQ